MEYKSSCEEVNLTPENEIPDDVFIEIEIPFQSYQYLSSEGCNLRNLCRICLAVNAKEMFPLFTNKERSILANMFTALTLIQVCINVYFVPTHLSLYY